MIADPDGVFGQTLAAERRLAAAKGRSYAGRLECNLEWDTGAPLPTILQWEHEAHVLFYLRSCKHVGAIIFERCVATRFGPPGEEGHALEGHGWEPHTLLEVINSAWLSKMVGRTNGYSHFLISFHDTSFECIARSFRTSQLPGTFADAVQQTIEQWD